jgi:hypothetical protein
MTDRYKGQAILVIIIVVIAAAMFVCSGVK